MGLSDEERTEKITWAVHNLSKLCRELEVPRYPKEPWQRLKDLGEGLWHALLGGESNGTFWIFGGAVGNPVKSADSPWGVLIRGQCEEARAKKEPPRRYDFDPFDGYLDLRGLVGQSGGDKAKVLDIYNSTEFLLYALRRYDDEFRAGFPELDKLCSDLLGACFTVMQDDQDFGKAYVGNRILVWVYGGKYGDDPLKKVFDSICLHHNLSRFMTEGTLAEVIAWDKWRLTHKSTPQNRVVLALRMAGRSFQYEHVLKKLIKSTRKMGIREDVLRREFAKCLKAHEDYEAAQSKEWEKSRQDGDFLIHGLDLEVSSGSRSIAAPQRRCHGDPAGRHHSTGTSEPSATSPASPPASEEPADQDRQGP